MLRKIWALCQGRLAPAGAHAQPISFLKAAAFIAEFRRQAASTLCSPLKKLVELKITTQRKCEDRGKLHSVVVRNAPDGIFVVDGDLQFVEVNDSLCRMWGMSRKEMLAYSLSELFADVDCEQDFFSDLLVRAKCRGEMSITARCGTVRCVQVEATALPNDQYMGLVRDITAQKQYENELRRTAEWRALLLRSLSEGLALVDRDGRVLLCNRAFEVVLGLSSSQLQEVSLLAPAHKYEQQAESWSLCSLHGATVYGAENPFYRALRWQQRVYEDRVQVLPFRKFLAVSAVPLCDERNQLLGAVVTLRDVTKSVAEESEQRVERFLQHQTQLLAVQRRFAEEVAWQIEEPASGIALYAHLLCDNLPPASEQAMLARGILQETHGLVETMRELKALARAPRMHDDVLHAEESEASFEVVAYFLDLQS